MKSTTPSFVIHVSEVKEEEGCYPSPFDAEKLSLGKDLGTAVGSQTIGLWQELLPPGRRTSFTHAHSREEELVYVLSGTCSLRVIPQGGSASEYPLRAGHIASFPAGTGIAHCIVNYSSSDAVLLVFGERRSNDRCSYPEDLEYDNYVRKTKPERERHRK